MEIGPTNGAGRNAHQQLSGFWLRLGNIAQLQRLLRRIQEHRAHERNYVQEDQERRNLFRMISAERKSGSARSGGDRPPLPQKRTVKRRKACAEMKSLV